jgi:sirohydrochlorin cobaltochelatase
MEQYKSTGILLVGHGTRSEVGTSQFLKLAREMESKFAPLAVEPAFLEMQKPDIGTAVGRLLGRGIARLVTVPLLLFAAGHAKRDIPFAVHAALRLRGAGHMEHFQAGHLGCHPALVELSHERMLEAAQHSEIHVEPNKMCLLLVGRGSQEDSATAEMHEFAEKRQALCGLKTEVAFLAMARPLLGDQLRHVDCQGYRRIIVQPHFLFDGELVDSVNQQVGEMMVSHRLTNWLIAKPLVELDNFVTPAAGFLQKVIVDRCREGGIHVVTTKGDD